ncbi:alpha/beta hydrolase [Roseofilum sp. BLCC_M154]|uniref:Alpha/beta hydrolase n=1 Tax=Roseofilum acuticapitatum BLCC-M154 TaxID=3022444 RepID=A0ABT7ASP2_9CYAN|nr:alpha/beta hydrolase [Roseofilum acuticapitatum]MDJ1169932.1 alpha/beta hydrolase [Roseofilum acuticapitatum BLCC-M154]
MKTWITLLAIAFFSPLISLPSWSAERIVFKYSVFRRSLSVAELTTFADTGEMTPALKRNLQTLGQNPEELRTLLTAPITIDILFLDRVLNSTIGRKILDRVAEIVHTPSQSSNTQALRAALILSASNDGEITLLETLQNYPTPDVEVEGERLIEAYEQLNRFAKPAQILMDLFK